MAHDVQHPPGVDQLKMFVLDVLQHDVAEQVLSIVKLLNNRGCIGWRDFWPHDFTQQEVIQAVQALMDDGLVTVYAVSRSKAELIEVDNRAVDSTLPSLWFGRSRKGELLWEEWIPPCDDEGKTWE